ncbi:hypothetical protein NSMM_370022 [Nitrosomonas mobilis]|uniref:Uncharacterized protein n=1 Tax=Nitrosomonas mobilis TaxID=51642 RepID=A0A1G5SDH4_9PROT|nr:hypothetical protein NSMM_370022 [Nitrosomonas mobilis]
MHLNQEAYKTFQRNCLEASKKYGRSVQTQKMMDVLKMMWQYNRYTVSECSF